MINSGIYKITNLVNHKIYVGSAINLDKRKLEHFNDLKRGNHHNNKLQRSFNKHGLENFYFEVIEYVELKENLIPREQYYIDTLKPYFNICKIAGSSFGNKHSEDTKDKIRKANIGTKRSKDSRVKMSISASKPRSEKFKDSIRRPIFQLDLITGAIIKEWPSIKDAQDIFKTTHIGKVCKGIYAQTKGFKWKYKEEKIWD